MATAYDSGNRKYLTDIKIEFRDYKSDFPRYIKEVDNRGGGKYNDINKDYGKKYVYLVAVWGSGKKGAPISDIRVRICDEEQKNEYTNLRGDFAKGCDSKYRYLYLTRNKRQGITDIKLWRTSDKNSMPSKQGWENTTGDLSKGRGGDYLYLCYQKEDMQPKDIQVSYEWKRLKVLNEKPLYLVGITYQNKTNLVQDSPSLEIGQDKSNTSSFTYSKGFEIEIGAEFSVGIPFFAESKFKMGVKTSHTWTNGRQETITKSHKGNFVVKCPPQTAVTLKAGVWNKEVEVPYIMTITFGNGRTEKSSGIWRGVVTFDTFAEAKQHSLHQSTGYETYESV